MTGREAQGTGGDRVREDCGWKALFVMIGELWFGGMVLNSVGLITDDSTRGARSEAASKEETELGFPVAGTVVSDPVSERDVSV